MTAKRVLAVVLAITMMFSLIVMPAAAAEPPTVTTSGMSLHHVYYSNDAGCGFLKEDKDTPDETAGFVIEIRGTSDSRITTAGVALIYDATVLDVVDNRTGCWVGKGKNSVYVAPSALDLSGLSTSSTKTVSASCTASTDYESASGDLQALTGDYAGYNAILCTISSSSAPATLGTDTLMAAVSFMYKSGKSVADLDENSVKLIESSMTGPDESPNQFNSLHLSAMGTAFLKGDGVTGYFTFDPKSAAKDNIEAYILKPELTFPRSGEDPIGPDPDEEEDVIEVLPDGSYKLKAPKANKPYSASFGISVGTGEELAGVTAENATIITKGADKFDFAYDGTEKKVTITSQGNVSEDYLLTKSEKLTATITIGSVDYTKDIYVTIPDVELPEKDLDNSSVTVVDKDGGWTLAALAAKFIGTAEGTGTGWTAVALGDVPASITDTISDPEGTTTVAEGNSVKFVAHIGANTETSPKYAETYAVLTVKVVKKPAATGIVSVSGTKAYTSTRKSITFSEATNEEWYYGISTDADWLTKHASDIKQPGVTTKDDATPDTLDGATQIWKKGVAADLGNGVAGGVTFDNLEHGTNYYLVIFAEDHTDSAIKVDEAALTECDLELQTATIAKIGEETDVSVKQMDGTVAVGTYKALSVSSVTEDTLDNFVQTVVILNNNPVDIKNLSVTVYEADNEGKATSTVSTLFTAAVTATTDAGATITDGAIDQLATSKTITVTVTPKAVADGGTFPTKGSNKAVLVITGNDGGSPANVILNKSFPMELVMSLGRAGAVTGTDDVILRPATLAEKSKVEGDKLAKTGEKFELDVKIGTAKPNRYRVPDEMTGKARISVEGEKTYLVLDKDVNTLGEYVTVTAEYDEDTEEHYISEKKYVKFLVQARPTDEYTDDEGKPVKPKVQTEYAITVPEGEDLEIRDLTGGLALKAETSIVKDPLTGETGMKTDAAIAASGENEGKLVVDKDTTLGLAKFTFTLAGMEKYSEQTVTVTVKVYGAHAPVDDGTDIELVSGKADGVSTDRVNVFKVAGATYTAVIDGTETEVEVKGQDANPYIDSIVTDGKVNGEARKITVTVTIAADDTEYTFGISATQTIIIREVGEVSVSKAEYSYGADGEDTYSAPVAIAATVKAETGAELSYEITEGDIITFADGKFTLDPAKYGKAIITISATETETKTAATCTVTIYNRKADDGGEGDEPGAKLPKMGDPTNGTGATIKGRKPGETGAFDQVFTVDYDEDGTLDSWAVVMGGVEFSGLTVGVAYQYRILELVENPENSGEYIHADHWYTDNGSNGGWQTLGDAEGVQSDSIGFGTSVDNVIAAQIRYTPDGTVGGTTIEEDEDGNFIIHGLISTVGYEYRVQKKANDSFEVIADVTDANGWRALPMKDAVPDTEDELTEEAIANWTGLMKYTVSREFKIKDVQTRYGSNPVIEKDKPKTGDYTISGLIPNTNYDLLEIGKSWTSEEDLANKVVRKSSATGTIVLEKDSDDYITLNIAAKNGVQIRKSATDDTGRGDPEPVVAGVTVSGDIHSYNHYNDVTIELFSMDDLNKAKYTKVIEGEPVPEKMSDRNTTRVDTHFEIEGVATGVTYQIRISKLGHMTTYINNVTIDEKYTLNMTAKNAGKPFVWGGKENAVNLICGQLDSDASQINAGDLSEVINSLNWGKTTPDNPATDLDGNGEVRAGDLSIVINSMSWLKKTENCTFDFSE